MSLKIRQREIIYRGPETNWSGQRVTEYQIIAGRKVVSRWETQDQAERALAELTPTKPQSPPHSKPEEG